MVRPRTMGAVAWGLALALSLPAAATEEASRRSWVERGFGQLPLYFVENRGQRDSSVSYSLAGREITVYFTDEGFTFALTTSSEVSLEFIDARRGVKPEGRGPTGLGTYASVVYREVWPGIDLSVDGSAGRMEYTFTVKPGADPRRIRMRYRRAESVRLDGSGSLEVATAAGSLRDQLKIKNERLGSALLRLERNGCIRRRPEGWSLTE